MKREDWYAVLALLFCVGIWGLVWHYKTDCEARGGKWLRGPLSAPECYDVRGTK